VSASYLLSAFQIFAAPVEDHPGIRTRGSGQRNQRATFLLARTSIRLRAQLRLDPDWFGRGDVLLGEFGIPGRKQRSKVRAISYEPHMKLVLMPRSVCDTRGHAMKSPRAMLTLTCSARNCHSKCRA
jgi:hypothetical protein